MIDDEIYKAVCELNGYSASPPTPSSDKVDCYIKPRKPGPPGIPTVSARNDTAHVTWTPTQDDGGAKVTNYKVEIRRSNQYTWELLNTNDRIPGTSYLVRGLVEGVEYELRVKAENEAGTGEPSQPSGALTYVGPSVFMRQLQTGKISDLTVSRLGNIAVTNPVVSSTTIYNRTFHMIKDISIATRRVSQTIDGQLVFTGADGKTIYFYSEDGTPIRTITCGAPVRQVTGIAVMPSGELVVTDFFNGKVLLLDPSNENITSIPTPGMFSYPHFAAIDKNNNIIVSDLSNVKVTILDTEGLALFNYAEPGSGEGQLSNPTGGGIICGRYQWQGFHRHLLRLSPAS
ncbi:unnamed protein product [Owenia fusiformis]|uniref:Fibronectin type-III domain-containing protein n=1 Tax=Owenia fusiformis TaxID=6347 RepID=A0A8S4N6H5_OWEFU|nr:unnamed protein product [Owenia fusiformis]